MAIAIGGIQGVTLEVRTHGGQILAVPNGREVVGRDGVLIGYLKGVRPDDMLVDRPLQRDVYVPFDAIERVTEHAIALTMPADQVKAMHWPHPPLL